MSGRRAAFAVAAKNARRNKKRTCYLVALIGLPVMVAVVVAAFIRASSLTPEERALADFGDASVRIENWSATPESANWLNATIADLDPNARTLTYRTDYLRFGAASGEVTDFDLENPLAGGHLVLTAGSRPTTVDEVVLTEHLARALDVSLGDNVTVTMSDGEVALEVVGLVSHPVLWGVDRAILTSEGFDAHSSAWAPGSTTLVDTEDDSMLASEIGTRWEQEKFSFYPQDREWPLPAELYDWIPDVYYAALTPEQLDEMYRLLDEEGGPAVSDYVYGLFPQGAAVSFPEVYAESRTDRLNWQISNLAEQPPVMGTAVAAVILAEVAFIAGAAFATGTRRRLREIGLLGANGADIRQVKTSVVGEGVVAGLGGGLVGALLAAIVLVVGRPAMQEFVSRRIDAFPLTFLDVLGPIAMAVLACVLAAWLPAKTAASVPTLTALQGRMPVAEPKRWIIPAGLGMAGFGTLLLGVGLATASTGGSVVAVIGAILMIGGMAMLAGPIVAWVSKHAEQFPITPRIVLRDSGRQRGRAAAAVAATMVILMAPVAVLAAVASEEANQAILGLPETKPQVIVSGRLDDQYQFVPFQEGDEAAILAVLPDARVAVFDSLDIPVEYPAELEARLSGRYPEDFGWFGGGDSRVAVANDDLLALLQDNRLEIALDREGIALIGVEERQNKITLDGDEIEIAEIPIGVARSAFPRVVVTHEYAAGLEGTSMTQALVEVDRVPFQLPGSSPFDPLARANPQFVTVGWSSDFSIGTVLTMAFLGALLIVLIVVATITALSAAEADGDLRTVVAVGATNSIRRKYLGLQSGLHTLIGALLAVPLTLLLYKTVTMASGSHESVGYFGTARYDGLYVPWIGVAVLVIGLPLAIGLITAASVRSAPTTPPRRAT